jgi:hypothetical protein
MGVTGVHRHLDTRTLEVMTMNSWDNEFRISRSQILSWLSLHEDRLAAKALSLSVEPDHEAGA